MKRLIIVYSVLICGVLAEAEEKSTLELQHLQPALNPLALKVRIYYT
jgi:hypothetical protein